MTAPTPYERLRAFPPHVREPALQLLDEMTKPLSPRDLEFAIQRSGFTRAEAKKVTYVLKRLQVVALVGR